MSRILKESQQEAKELFDVGIISQESYDSMILGFCDGVTKSAQSDACTED